MTAQQIITRVANRLNLTSSDALTRILGSVNERYRQVRAEIGMRSIAPGTVSISTAIGVRTIAVPGVQVYAVRDPASSPAYPLNFVPYEEFQKMAIGSDHARDYTVESTTGSTVTIKLSSIPASVYALEADVDVVLGDIADTQVPAFSADFHDILELWAMAVELEKKEKYQAADEKKAESERRLDQLKFYQAKTKFKNLQFGGPQGTRRAPVARLPG